MTHDRISQELAQRQLPLVTAAIYSDRWSVGVDSTENLADAINHARLTGTAQLLVESHGFNLGNDETKAEKMEKFNSNTRALFDALALPDEQLDFRPLKCVGEQLYVLTITRTLKKG